MSAAEDDLEGQQQHLDPQQHDVHETDRVDDVKGHGAQSGDLTLCDRVGMVGSGDAATARGHALPSARIERLQEHEQGPRPGNLLGSIICSPPRNWPAAI